NRLSVDLGIVNQYGIGNVVTARAEGNGNDTTTDCSKRRSRDQLNSEEFDFMAAADAYNEIEEVNTDYTLKDNLQQASPSGTQTDSAPVMIQMDQLRYTILKIVMIMIYSICLLKRSSILIYSNPI
nr:hypothetical protein [Tanacetum cinerariifolium]